MPLPKCETCQFWVKEAPDRLDGECHRYAPRPKLDRAERHEDECLGVLYWPITEINEGCGEHRPIETNDAPIPYGRMTDGPIA